MLSSDVLKVHRGTIIFPVFPFGAWQKKPHSITLRENSSAFAHRAEIG